MNIAPRALNFTTEDLDALADCVRRLRTEHDFNSLPFLYINIDLAGDVSFDSRVVLDIDFANEFQGDTSLVQYDIAPDDFAARIFIQPQVVEEFLCEKWIMVAYAVQSLAAILSQEFGAIFLRSAELDAAPELNLEQ